MAPSAVTVYPAAAPPSKLLDANSPELELVLATPEESIQCALLNYKSWSGPLAQEAYLRRERHLASQEAALNGAHSGWILVDKSDTKHPRTILAACESIKKRAFVARRGGERAVEEVVVFAIGSVFCREEYRGRGYAVRMMAELQERLETWQQKAGQKTTFTVLFSDIGKKFYAKNGWIPYESSHISLRSMAATKNNKHRQVKLLTKNDLPMLCQKDEALLKRTVGHFSNDGPDTRVALVPSSAMIDWHHAREEFLAHELFGRKPEIKGAYVESATSGKAVWCIFSRVFARENGESVLFILRWVIEDEDCTSSEPSSAESVQAVAACLAAAQEQAGSWEMDSVQAWNPSPTVLAGARLLQPNIKIVDREDESITSLNWYGTNARPSNIQWLANEKFGWF